MLLTTSQSVSGPTSRSPSSHFCSASKRLWKRQQLRPVAAPLGTSRSPAWGNKRASAMRWRASSPCCLRLAYFSLALGRRPMTRRASWGGSCRGRCPSEISPAVIHAGRGERVVGGRSGGIPVTSK
jgi:hypothetical protein